MSTSPAASTPPPAGWYQDPHGTGQRYWDGTAWTEHIAAPSYAPPAYAPAFAAAGAGPAQQEASAGDWIGGVLLAVIIPIVGLIAGAVYIARNDHRRTVGIVTTSLSAAMIVLWTLVTLAGGSGA